MTTANSEKTILALETATSVCSVALQHKNEVLERRAVGRGIHSEKTFLFIDDLLREHTLSVEKLDAVLVSAGPGSYTGLRIAASGIKGLLFEREVPLFAVHTLAAFAQSVVASADKKVRKGIHAVIDARRTHLYHAQFTWSNENGLVIEVPTAVRHLREVQDQLQANNWIIGSGIDRLDEIDDTVTVLEMEEISAQSLLSLFSDSQRYNYPEQIIQPVDVADFDPRYYTSNQVAKKS
ncbi:MAG: tRNA (adenosine(37)-N6)-threonylcarbamoyltransferase complex dimerization subunit type 1 TsaB [Bacteroidota bacterium]